MRLAVENISDFDAIYRQHHRAVYANICKMVKQAESAEDLLQEVFLALWQNRQKITADKAAGWLFVVSYNKAVSYLKNRIRHSFVQLEDLALAEKETRSDPSQEVYQLQLSLIEDAIQHLPERKKEAFRLHFFEGRSYEEIATLLDISINPVKDYIKQSAGFIRKYTDRTYDGSLADGSLATMASLVVVCFCAS